MNGMKRAAAVVRMCTCTDPAPTCGRALHAIRMYSFMREFRLLKCALGCPQWQAWAACRPYASQGGPDDPGDQLFGD